MTYSPWNDLTPSRRCDWIDQLRGWAVIVMIEVHCVNLWLDLRLRPDWLNYLNGLVAPSFLMAAGFSLVLSTFRADGTLRPFKDSAKRYAFILMCAYLLHAPGLTLAEWSVLSTPQKLKELFKIDVLQCTVYSLLLLQALARTLRNPRAFTAVALALALFIPLVSPALWTTGIGDGLWLPLRGLLNGNADRGVQALFPLFPWMAFPAFGAFLGGFYRWTRVEADAEGTARWSELRWLTGLALVGAALWAWGHHFSRIWFRGDWLQNPDGTWLLHGPWGAWTHAELGRLHNTTLPSVLERLGWISMVGAALGAIELRRPRLPGPNPVEASSRESLLLYMAHLNLLFGLLMAAPLVAITGLDWNSQRWPMTAILTIGVIGANLALGLYWQRVRKDHDRMRRIQFRFLGALAVWALFGGWLTFNHFLRSPEFAREPYPFLNTARARKGLPPTPDGLCRDPEEYFREAQRRRMKLSPEAKARLAEQIGQRGK